MPLAASSLQLAALPPHHFLHQLLILLPRTLLLLVFFFFFFFFESSSSSRHGRQFHSAAISYRSVSVPTEQSCRMQRWQVVIPLRISPENVGGWRGGSHPPPPKYNLICTTHGCIVVVVVVVVMAASIRRFLLFLALPNCIQVIVVKHTKLPQCVCAIFCHSTTTAAPSFFSHLHPLTSFRRPGALQRVFYSGYTLPQGIKLFNSETQEILNHSNASDCNWGNSFFCTIALCELLGNAFLCYAWRMS